MKNKKIVSNEIQSMLILKKEGNNYCIKMIRENVQNEIDYCIKLGESKVTESITGMYKKFTIEELSIIRDFADLLLKED